MRKGNTANARECALSVLVACRRNGAWADAALKAQLGKCALSAQDAALCSRIVYGVMQNELLLNWYLSAYCTQKLDHLQPPLSEILRIGAFIDYLSSCMSVSREVHLVLHGLKELLCRFCPWVIVYAERIDFQFLAV